MSNYYIIPIFVSHKGCPHDCVFCNQKRITGVENEIGKEDVENTIDLYLKTIDRENSYVEVSFFGGSFTGIPIEIQSELLEVASRAKRNGKVDAIRLSTRPDYIDAEILENLKRYNVDIIELGVQSMDENVLSSSERGHTATHVIDAVRLIKKYEFKLGLQMMIGLPNDTEDKDIFTAKQLISLEPDFVRIYPTLVIKDTQLEYLYKSGKYMPLTVDEAVEISKNIYSEFIKNDIQVIRIGLQPTEQINIGRDVIAGPFHPAFRELVESSILNEMLGNLILQYFKNSDFINIYISPRDISKLFADGKKYFYKIVSEFNTQKLIIRQNSTLDNLKLCLEDGKKEKTMSLYEYIKLVK